MKLFTQVNKPVEFSFTATRAYADIFHDVDVDVLFSGPDGRTWRVPAFWGGENTFRVRFAAPLLGTYQYYSECSSPEDNGLHGQSGTVEVAPYTGTNPLYRHGRLGVAESGRTFEHEDGTPFFWLGDTWWAGLTPRLDWPRGFKELAGDRVAKGFTLVQIVAGPLPEFLDPWHPQQANEAGWPWERDWTRINPAFYDLADLRLASLVEHGLVPCIVGMWAYYLLAMGAENVKKHWRYLVARYGAYPVCWCLAGEVNLPLALYHELQATDLAEVARLQALGKEEARQQVDAWSDVLRYLAELDPYQNPRSAHPINLPPMESRGVVNDAALLDFVMAQTGHGGYFDLKPTVEMLDAAIHREPRMPVLNSEVCYEGIMGGNQHEVQRFLFWSSITTGAAGHTYGAQGLWGMSSRDEHYSGAAGNWGDGVWQDVMHYPGATHLGIGQRFFARYPWWLLEPLVVDNLPEGRISAFAAGIPGALAIYYLPAGCMPPDLSGTIATWNGRLGAIPINPAAQYHAYFFDPRTGVDLEIGPVQPDAEGRWTPPKKPTMDDWVLVLEDCRKPREKHE